MKLTRSFAQNIFCCKWRTCARPGNEANNGYQHSLSIYHSWIFFFCKVNICVCNLAFFLGRSLPPGFDRSQYCKSKQRKKKYMLVITMNWCTSSEWYCARTQTQNLIPKPWYGGWDHWFTLIDTALFTQTMNHQISPRYKTQIVLGKSKLCSNTRISICTSAPQETKLKEYG